MLHWIIKEQKSLSQLTFNLMSYNLVVAAVCVLYSNWNYLYDKNQL